MNRRVLYWSVLLTVLVILLFGIQGSNANDDGNTSRFKTVEIRTTQYVWELVSLRDGTVYCQAILDRPTRPTYDETITLCGDSIFPAEPSPTPMGTPETTAVATPGPSQPFDLGLFFSNVYWRFVRSQELVRTVQVPLPEIITHLNAPSSPREELFVTLTAYEPIVGEEITGIFGILNGREFTCPGARCDVPISGDSVLEFWAVSSFGDESTHVQATLRQLPSEQGKRLEVSSLGPIPPYIDSCAAIWGSSATEVIESEWARFPDTPEDLATMKPYQYLAGQLLSAGVVNASECPGGGLTSTGAPNACGLEKAGPAVIEWQNQFDITIWDTGRKTGIPPTLLKVLLDQESQFWPANSRRYLLEFGLGQLSQTGADVALRWDNELYKTICRGLIFDCTTMYGRLPSWLQAMMRGGLMRAVDTECPTCQYGVDIVKTHETIPIIARTLRSNCRQVNYMVDRRGLETSYEDLWRYTFVSYHSGYQCLADALNNVLFRNLPSEWAYTSLFLTCPGSVQYINEVWNSLEEFDQYRIKRPEISRPVELPTFIPTVAPTLTPTPVRAFSHILVQVYVDRNGNRYPEISERVDGVKVEVRLPDGRVLQAVTANGEADIDLTGLPVDIDVTVALPDLFRTQRVRVLRDGEIPVIFRLEEPVVPPGLP